MKQIQLTRGQVALVDDSDVHPKQHYLGCFLTREEAAKAYDRAAMNFFGEFAVLNFPINA